MNDKCERCRGSGTRCAGAGQCDHDGSDCFDLVVNGINQNCGEYEPHPCPDCNGTGTKPEPEQEERIREDFEKVMDYPECRYSILHKSYYIPDDLLMDFDDDRVDYTNQQYTDFKAGYTSRNAEIEHLKETHRSEIKAIVEIRRADVNYILQLREENKKQTEEIEALKAEIKSMRRCWNCDNRFDCDNADLDYNGCDYWTRKNK